MMIIKTSEMIAQLEEKRLKAKLNIAEKQINNLIITMERGENEKEIPREEIAKQLLNIADFISMD